MTPDEVKTAYGALVKKSQDVCEPLCVVMENCRKELEALDAEFDKALVELQQKCQHVNTRIISVYGFPTEICCDDCGKENVK